MPALRLWPNAQLVGSICIQPNTAGLRAFLPWGGYGVCWTARPIYDAHKLNSLKIVFSTSVFSLAKIHHTRGLQDGLQMQIHLEQNTAWIVQRHPKWNQWPVHDEEGAKGSPGISIRHQKEMENYWETISWTYRNKVGTPDDPWWPIVQRTSQKLGYMPSDRKRKPEIGELYLTTNAKFHEHCRECFWNRETGSPSIDLARLHGAFVLLCRCIF